MRIRDVILFILCIAALPASGQTLKAFVEAAENSMEEKDYNSAYYYYGITVEIDSSRLDLRYNLAESARLYHAYAKAEPQYIYVLEQDNAGIFPETAYWLAHVQQVQGKYRDAIANYQVYLGENYQEDSTLTARAERMIQHCQWAEDNYVEITDSLKEANDTLKIEKLDGNVNTSFSEVAALHMEDSLLFSRLGYWRKDSVKKKEVPPAYLYSKILNYVDSTATPLDTTLNDSLRHTAHTTFNHDKSRVFYTICDYLNRYDIQCDIYFKDIDLDSNKWGEAQRLPEPINLDTFTSTQPNVAYDYIEQKDVLYFVSDREGGKGGLDIWYSYINDDNTLTEPENLSEINTPFDEVTPFFHEESSSLYYSTDGELGFGGYDIFRVEKQKEVWGEPENLGPWYNSSYNDVYYSLSGDEATAHFSSNKIGSSFLDSTDQACCYDIYKAEKAPIELHLIVETYNEMTGEPLTDVTLYIEQRNGEVINVTQTTGATNRYEMELIRNREWSIRGEKRLFNPDFTSFSTYNIRKSDTLVHKLYLDPSDIVVQVETYELRRKVPLINTYVDLRDADGNVLDTKVERYSHITYFTVRPDENYSLRGYRKGFLKAFEDITREELIDQDTIVKELFLELGNLNDFLPLAIFFDNDTPRPSTADTNTDVRYLLTFDAYYARKGEYMRRYTEGLSGDELEEARQDVDRFFDDQLKLGREEFAAFLNILEQYLAEDLTFTIYLKGYASPLASAEYNQALGRRRISTIQNEFAAYKGGILLDYIDSGDLVVTEKSFGEGTAPPGVSDDARNKRLSIYAPGAARERRVEIIEIQKDNPQQ